MWESDRSCQTSARKASGIPGFTRADRPLGRANRFPCLTGGRQTASLQHNRAGILQLCSMCIVLQIWSYSHVGQKSHHLLRIPPQDSKIFSGQSFDTSPVPLEISLSLSVHRGTKIKCLLMLLLAKQGEKRVMMIRY